MTSLPINALPLFIENRLRHKVWWVHPVLLLILIQPLRPIAYITIGYICFLALKDYLTMLPTQRIDRLTVLIAYLTIPFMIYWAATDRYGIYLLWVPLVVFLSIMLSLNLRKKRILIQHTIRPLLFGLMFFLFGIGHLVVLMTTENSFGATLIPRGDMLYLVVLVQFATLVSLIRNVVLRPFIDNGAHSIPTILFITLITSLFSVIIAPLFIVIPIRLALVLGAVAGSALFAGQMWINDLQTQLGISEYKRIYPGYGGILLQIAGYTLAAPIYHTLLLLQI
jgi:phosphatidate cytidylyltransferase